MEINRNTKWPIRNLVTYKYDEHSAWYSGEAEVLANFYASATLQDFLPLQFAARNNNKFWSRQIKNNSDFFIHVPVAGDISETSAAFLFSESPQVAFISEDGTENEKNQSELDKMLLKTGFFNRILEAAETASAMGGVYLKLAWDGELSQYPVPLVVQADMALPTFKMGILSEVTFVYEYPSGDYKDSNTIYRLFETYKAGSIDSKLMQGTPDKIGEEVSLNVIEQTKGIMPHVDTAGTMCAVYVPNMLPNRLMRSSELGRSDYAGIETLMDSLDEVFSAWMVDVQIARGKIHVPMDYIKFNGAGGRFNIDKNIYKEMDMDPTNMSGSPINATQFAIRSAEFETTALNLLDRIITSAGYSPQSFGLNIQGRAESGVALNVRERKSFSTTSKKEAYWETPLKDIIKAMCVVYNTFLGGNILCDYEVNIAFADCISNNQSETASCVKMLKDAQAISTDTAVRMVHPEWSEKQVEEEVERILNEGSANQPMENPEDLSQLQFGGEGINNQEGGEGSSELK